MGDLDLQAFLNGNFNPDQRAIKLHKRLKLYYKQTPAEMDIRESILYAKALKKWCVDRGYTRKEVSRAKRDIRIQP